MPWGRHHWTHSSFLLTRWMKKTFQQQPKSHKNTHNWYCSPTNLDFGRYHPIENILYDCAVVHASSIEPIERVSGRPPFAIDVCSALLCRDPDSPPIANWLLSPAIGIVCGCNSAPGKCNLRIAFERGRWTYCVHALLPQPVRRRLLVFCHSTAKQPLEHELKTFWNYRMIAFIWVL